MPVAGCIVKISSLEYTEDMQIASYTESTRTLDYNLLLVDQDECIHCSACVEVCQVDCIELQKISKLNMATDTLV